MEQQTEVRPVQQMPEHVLADEVKWDGISFVTSPADKFASLDPFKDAFAPPGAIALGQDSAIQFTFILPEREEGDFFTVDNEMIAAFRSIMSIVKPTGLDSHKYATITMSRSKGTVRVSYPSATAYFEFFPAFPNRLTQKHEFTINMDKFYKLLNKVYHCVHHIYICEDSLEVVDPQGLLNISKYHRPLDVDAFTPPVESDYNLVAEGLQVSSFIPALSFVGKFAIANANCREIAIYNDLIVAQDHVRCVSCAFESKAELSLNPDDAAGIVKFFTGCKVGDVMASNAGTIMNLYIHKESMKYMLSFMKFGEKGKQFPSAFIIYDRPFPTPTTEWLPDTLPRYKENPPAVTIQAENAELKEAIKLLKLVSDSGSYMFGHFSGSGKFRIFLMTNLGQQSYNEILTATILNTSSMFVPCRTKFDLHYIRLLESLKLFTSSSYINIATYDNPLGTVLLITSETQRVFMPSVVDTTSSRKSKR
jgi:hypothetical protein